MCFLKVKDGHLTILTDCPILSFWPELSNCSHLESVMVCVMIKIFSKFNFEKKKKEAGMEPYTVTIMAQVSQLTFLYLLRLAITPYCP